MDTNKLNRYGLGYFIFGLVGCFVGFSFELCLRARLAGVRPRRWIGVRAQIGMCGGAYMRLCCVIVVQNHITIW